jgi:hypothetical protein
MNAKPDCVSAQGAGTIHSVDRSAIGYELGINGCNWVFCQLLGPLRLGGFCFREGGAQRIKDIRLMLV